MSFSHKVVKGATWDRPKHTMPHRQRILCFAPELETQIMQLYRTGCARGESVLRRFPSVADALADTAAKREFYAAAHSGFTSAQDQIVSRLLELEKAPEPASHFLPEEVALREVADAIAWQIIGSQLYIARRFFGDQAPQQLGSSNHLSVQMAAKHLVGGNLQKFALLSDLTTFVQIGDPVVTDEESGKIAIVEVKEGRKNHEYLEALQLFADPKCGSFQKHFYEQEGKKGMDQLFRLAKQQDRMANMARILKTGKGREPFRENAMVTIPEQPVETEVTDHAISSLVDKLKTKDWAIDVVDNCLFVGAYKGGMLPVAEAAFQMWFKLEAEGRSFPVVNLNHCMTLPLALPIFSRHLSESTKADLLFGRCKVILGLQLNGFIALLNELGGLARWGTRTESARANRNGDALMVDHQAILFRGINGADGVIGDGVLVRIFSHGIAPSSLAKALVVSHAQASANSGKEAPC